MPTQHGVYQEKTHKKRSGMASGSKFVMRDSKLHGCSVRGKRLDSSSPLYALTIQFRTSISPLMESSTVTVGIAKGPRLGQRMKYPGATGTCRLARSCSR